MSKLIKRKPIMFAGFSSESLSPCCNAPIAPLKTEWDKTKNEVKFILCCKVCWAKVIR